ncbi:hypothetical protein PINS_up022432 [Pythium insidiosum]|nr:hypothetical protein PINS_up022432 [Pythium insidiosum]
MNSPRRHELDTLQSIEAQAKNVQDRVDERLPTQRQYLLAFVAAWRWRVQTLRRRLQQHEIDSIAKKIRLEVGAFDYQVKEQSELLTRYLCQLDNVLSYGDATIKDARKALVLHIQTLLQRADALKTVASKLKVFTESVIASFPTAEPSNDPTPNHDAAEMENVVPLFADDETTDDVEMEHGDEEDASKTEEVDDNDMDADDDADEQPQQDDAEDEAEDDEDAEEEESQEEEAVDEETEEPSDTCLDSEISLARLAALLPDPEALGWCVLAGKSAGR